MSELVNISNTPIEYTTRNGNKYQLSKPSLGQYAAYAQWIKSDKIQQVMVIDDLEPIYRNNLITSIMSEDWSIDQLLIHTANPGSAIKLLHLTVCANGADIDLESFGNSLDIMDMVDMQTILMDLIQVDTKPKNAKKTKA